jgi:hypothetical protein
MTSEPVHGNLRASGCHRSEIVESCIRIIYNSLRRNSVLLKKALLGCFWGKIKNIDTPMTRADAIKSG